MRRIECTIAVPGLASPQDLTGVARRAKEHDSFLRTVEFGKQTAVAPPGALDVFTLDLRIPVTFETDGLPAVSLAAINEAMTHEIGRACTPVGAITEGIVGGVRDAGAAVGTVVGEAASAAAGAAEDAAWKVVADHPIAAGIATFGALKVVGVL